MLKLALGIGKIVTISDIHVTTHKAIVTISDKDFTELKSTWEGGVRNVKQHIFR